MKGALHLLAGLLVAAFAVGSYRINFDTQAAFNRVDDLHRAIAREREALAVLNAEWAYLNGPIRLARLARTHQASLRLAPMTPEHFGQIADLPPRPQPDNPEYDPEAALEALFKATAPPMLAEAVRRSPAPFARPERRQ